MKLHAVQQHALQLERYLQPASLEEALEMLASNAGKARLIAGGTDLLLELARGVRPGVDTLIDLSRIARLDRIEFAGDSIAIGAGVTHNEIVTSELVVARALPLAQACWEIASPQLRNRATVVGNVVTASPANDTITPLRALGTVVQIASVGEQREVSLADFHHGIRKVDLAADEMVTGLRVRAMGSHERGVFVKLGLRKAQAISVVHVALVLDFDGEIVTSASIALGSVAPTIVMAEAAADFLRGQTLDDEVIAEAGRLVATAATPIADLRGSAEYRSAQLELATTRALDALGRSEQAQFFPRSPISLGRRKISHSQSTRVNGITVTDAPTFETTLLDWLRALGLTGSKEGCAEGECGACTVFLDGVAVMSCLVPAGRAQGAEITTIEALASDGELHRLQQAFLDEGAVQCGFCIPGFLMSGAMLLDERTTPSPEDIRTALSGNLCRCTGYYKIIAAVEQASPAMNDLGVTSIHRIDGRGKVTGEALFPADLKRDDFLHARIVFTDQPHARLTKLDVAPALATPGVVEVVTADDVPVNEYGLVFRDQPVLIGPNQNARSPVPGDVSRWEADQLCVVIAESVAAATRGAEAVVAEWEELPLLADVDNALSSSVLLHPENGKDTNAYHHLRIRKGDIDAGWAAAEVVIEGAYELPLQEHAYLQPEAAISYLDDNGRLTVEIAGQWTVEDQEQIAHALDLPMDRVRVIYPSIGGAFGGREDMSMQIVLALATQKLAARGISRPIRCQWSREESIVGHHKRHRGKVTARLGATREGKLVAVEADCYLDAGGYNYTSNKVLGNLHLCVGGPYEIPNARIDSFAVYTNAVPGGAFRGFGAPQGAFVAETQMNKLAVELGMDPVELRLRNSLRDGSVGITQVELPLGVSLPEVIEAAATASTGSFEPRELRPMATVSSKPSAVRRGRGFACAYKNIGFSFGFPERCEAYVELHGDDKVERAILFHGAAEVGQGAHTALKQMTAMAVGIDIERVETVYSDTAITGDSGSASASRLTWMSGNSILGAVEEANKKWQDGDRPARGEFRFIPPPTEVLDAETGIGQPNFAYGYVAEVVDLSVDVETGHIQVDRVICANDLGRIINRQLAEGQLEGAVVQAHGYAITEDLQVKDARLTHPRLSAYLIPGIDDIPTRVESILLEHPDPRGPWGARGMAEMPLIPYAAAVVAALHDATGVWFHEIPLTPSRVLAGLTTTQT